MLGEGILKGMAETARNFVGSYHDPAAADDRAVSRRRVPREGERAQFPVPGVSTGRTPWQGLRCVACQICEKECPPQCIYIVKDTVKKPDYVGKPQFQPKMFDIDISVCMSCQICVEVCPFDAIKMDIDFELSQRRSVRRPAAAQARAGEVQRVLPQDPSHRGRGSGRAPGGGEGQDRGQSQGGRRSQSPIGRRRARAHPAQARYARAHPMIAEILKGFLTMLWKVVGDQPDPKADFLAPFPDGIQPVVSVLLSIVPIMVVFPLLFAVTTLLERKGLGRIQNRLGPNRVGKWGLLQPIADGLKMVTKEDIVPLRADKLIHFLAPVVLVVPTLLAYAVLPFGRNMVPIDLDAGILFFFAVGAATELAVFMAGWSSRNKYSLLGAMRAHRPDDQLRDSADPFRR